LLIKKDLSVFRRKSRLTSREEFFVDEKSLRSLSEATGSESNKSYWKAKRSGHAYLTKQESYKMEYPKFSTILNQKFFEFIAEQFDLNHDGNHGYDHWLRVLLNGRILCEQNSANIKVVELFALLHDSKRTSEDADSDHGERAAIFAESLRDTWFSITDQEMRLLQDACILHSEGFKDKDVTLQTCWDADRLDHFRFESEVDFALLSDELKNHDEIIFDARERSINRVFT
tara:strand:- start:6855 stop:7544 length:690 start_codon:yes stop_codon:yes gene_type:complete